MGFNDILSKIEFDELLNYHSTLSKSAIERALTETNQDIYRFLSLISNAADLYLERIAELTHELTIRQFGKSIALYTPLYLANYCQNSCLYCGFNHDSNIERSALNRSEIISELEAIHKMGLRDVLLLTGESRVHSDVEYIADAVRLAKKNFKSVGIEVYPMAEDEYRLLIDAGVNSLTIY